MRASIVGFGLFWTGLLIGPSGCAPQVISLFEQSKMLALAKPVAAPREWQPDAVVDFSTPQLNALIAAGVQASGGLKKTYKRRLLFQDAAVRTSFEIQNVDLKPSNRCNSCFTVALALQGNVRWALGARDGDVPVGAAISFDTEMLAHRHDASWNVTAKLHDVKSLDLRWNSQDGALKPLLETSLGEWLRESLLRNASEVQLGTFGSAEVPLRGFRLSPLTRGLRVEMLTEAVSPVSVMASKEPPLEGFRVSVSADSIADLARTMSFQQGAVGYDVVVEPTSMVFQGGKFDLAIRLWRPVGRGWWRDYVVHGAMALGAKGVVLTPKSIDEGAKSKGALWVDPLASLGEGFILKTIETSVATTLPLPDTTSGALPIRLVLNNVMGDATMLVVNGRLDPVPPSANPVPSR